jgi:hypothetical protein
MNTSVKNTVVQVGSSRGANRSGRGRTTVRQSRSENVSSKRSCKFAGETERIELLRRESEDVDEQFNSSDEVRDDDSEIVVFPQGRECPSSLNNIEGAIIADDRVTKHSRLPRSRSSRLANKDSTTENKSTNRSFDGISQPPASFRRDTANRMGKQHKLRSQRRSFSADQCDEEIRYEPAGRSRPRFGSLASECRKVDQSIEMPRFDGTGDLELFIRRLNTIAEYCNWPTDEKLFRLKNCIHGDAQ